VVTTLPDDVAARLREAPFTYPEVGATTGELPGGYRHVKHSRRIEGRSFEEATELLMTWQIHERAGLSVAASPPRVTQGAVVEMRLGLGRASLRVPCRIVYLVDEADRVGFAYGTLPGHPESGEELFLVERSDDGSVEVTITAFSNPVGRLARWGGPVTRRVQDQMTRRYAASFSPRRLRPRGRRGW
jgi:uncharacterized protein (UPF0548 family)